MPKRDDMQSKGVVWSHLSLPALVGVLAAVSLLLAVTGPFNTYGLGDFTTRLVYWSVLVVASSFLAAGLLHAVGCLNVDCSLKRELLVIFLFCTLFTPLAVVWTNVIFPASADVRPGFAKMFVYMLGICCAISALRYGLPGLLQRLVAPQDAARVPAEAPRFLRRLPDDFDGEILRLSGDGHYVNVLTTKGPYDVRIRLSDAVDEMDGIDGFWVHRSHWVARAAVRSNEVEKGRPVLILSNGDTVPVSAKYKPQLEETGVLDAMRV